jgi:hypothetical protein
MGSVQFKDLYPRIISNSPFAASIHLYRRRLSRRRGVRTQKYSLNRSDRGMRGCSTTLRHVLKQVLPISTFQRAAVVLLVRLNISHRKRRALRRSVVERRRTCSR